MSLTLSVFKNKKKMKSQSTQVVCVYFKQALGKHIRDTWVLDTKRYVYSFAVK